MQISTGWLSLLTDLTQATLSLLKIKAASDVKRYFSNESIALVKHDTMLNNIKQL